MKKPEFLHANTAFCAVLVNALGVGVACATLVGTGISALACNVPAATSMIISTYSS